jgi:hypothetical protein
MSCAATNEKSLFFGDIDGRIKQYYSSINGFSCFDYSKVRNFVKLKYTKKIFSSTTLRI